MRVCDLVSHGFEAISLPDGEREIARRAMEAGARLITLSNKGFAKLFKPSGKAFESASEAGKYVYDEDEHVVTWTLANVPAGKEGIVRLTVKVLESALESYDDGPGKVVNEGTTV